MDRSSGSILFNGHPPSPAPPLALSEFIAQTPCSDYTTCDGPSLRPGVEKMGDIGERRRADEEDKPRLQTPQQRPAEDPAPPSNAEQGAAPLDWLATRSQLLPRRNQGGKADWVRGWSEAVGVHGEETYCACSETVAGDKVWKGRASGLASNVRAILQAASPTSRSPAKSEPDLCRNCSRPPSSPPSTATSSASETPGLQRSRVFGRKVNEFLMRVKPRQSKSGHGCDAGYQNIVWPENYQPKWATDHRRLLVRPPEQPVQKSHSMDIFPGHNRHRITAPSSGSLSGSDAPRAGAGMSRLKRAAALLQRTNPPRMS